MIGPYASHQRRFFSPLDVVLLALLAAMVVWLGPGLIRAGEYRWNWSVIWRYMVRYDPVSDRMRPNVLLNGFFTTIRLSIWSGVVAMIIGLVMGVLASRRRLLARLVTRTYVEFARNTPPLVLVFLFYYFLGQQITAILGLEQWVAAMDPRTARIVTILAAPPRQLPAFVSAVATLGIFEGAYLTEIVRAGIQSVPKGQWEAGYALGLSSRDRYRFVVLPQAWRVVLPAAVGQFISIIKDSSIVAVISIPELTFQGLEVMAATYRTFEIWITIALMYFLLSSICSWGARGIERRLARHVAR
ncbi:MAG: amino acid ABC transporter permease [Spirochaetaceae bacterium]|nr:MAG: amino acid ABC transporter permease [Spirochaetaceae bacterium]